MSDDQQRQRSIEPFALSINETTRVEDAARSIIYERLSRGEYKPVEAGTKVRIRVSSIRERRERLPPAEFKLLSMKQKVRKYA
jgi:hypothetical protein